MKIICAKCGEELLGAVNRCWKCGTEFDLPSGDEDGPPVRRAPIADLHPAPSDNANLPVMAELADSEVSSTSSATPLPRNETGSHTLPASAATQPAHEPALSTLDTAAGAERKGAEQTKPPAMLPSPRFRISHRYGGWLGGLALVIGLSSAAFSYHSFWALAGSFLGLALGIWALAGQRRGAAMLGIIFCCIALTVSGYRIVLVAYESVMGYSPFEQGLPVEEPFPDPENGVDPFGEDR